eukprot:2709510-Pleurochrysis_carterae.AAC.1
MSRRPIGVGVTSQFVSIYGCVSQPDVSVMIQVHKHTARACQQLLRGAAHGATQHVHRKGDVGTCLRGTV